VLTSLIRSHIEYLIHTYYIFAYFIVKIDEKSSLTDGIYTI